jgi:serine/threonine protein kinase
VSSRTENKKAELKRSMPIQFCDPAFADITSGGVDLGIGEKLVSLAERNPFQLIGQTISHYRILKKIGAGGMGEVYRATDTKLGRDVALKVLPAEMARDADRLARFQREARSVAALNHPHIVTLHSVEEAGGVHFLTMELVEGRSLQECIPPSGLPIERVLHIASAIAEALAAAHEKGIVHRDLKPANVMMTEDGRVKVLDFGLAKEAPAASHSEATLTSAGDTAAGVVMGTPAYMSPEQLTGQAIDQRSDIFSLGVMLYEMATGQRPFQGRSSAELASSILRDTPTPVTEVRADLPGDLGRIIRRCLEKQPRDRIQTARDVGNEFKDLARQTSQKSTASSSPIIAGAARLVRSDAVVVVLPFVNRSADSGNEYFSDGLTEEIITDLSRISALRVISRNSSMALKGARGDTRAIARQLGVTHVVSGSVRRAGDALRVTAELIEASSDAPLWSEKYSGTVEDVFGIQEEIARKIVAALKIKLTDSGEQRVASRPIENMVAYDCYLRARQEIYNWVPEAQDRANRLVDQALAVVGENSLLLATKGQIIWNKVNAMMDSDEQYLEEAAEFARRSLALNREEFLGIFLRGLVAGVKGETASALWDIQRAHLLRPGDPNIRAEMCRFTAAAGVEDGDFVKELVALDPLTPVTWILVSFDHIYKGRIQEGLPGARRIIEVAPDVSLLHILAAMVFAIAGERGEAIELLERIARKLAGTLHGSWALFLKYAMEGDASRCCGQMTPQLEKSASLLDHVARTVADGYSLIGKNDEALKWIRIAMNRGFTHYPFLAKHDVLLANVRSDSRFPELMREVRTRWETLGKNLPEPLRLVTLPKELS